MPFTVSHAAAVLPIPRFLGNRVSLSALIIGSMSPDLPYFLRVFSGVFSHTLLGIIVLCLPLGLVCYAIFHGFCKRPATALLPDFLSARLATQVFEHRLWPDKSISSVVFSIILGALTHIGWDAFTHHDTPLTVNVPFFQYAVFTLAGHPLYVYKLLQYLSSIVGLLVIAGWIQHWIHANPPTQNGNGKLSKRVRYKVIAGIVANGIAGGILGGLPELNSPYEQLMFFIITTSINGVFLGFGLYCLAWHLLIRRL
jgi:hypothetical protein